MKDAKKTVLIKYVQGDNVICKELKCIEGTTDEKNGFLVNQKVTNPLFNTYQ